MKTEKSNKIISEFKGTDYEEEMNSIWNDAYNNGIRNQEYMNYPANYLYYHSSWDWLMPIIKRINEIVFTKEFRTFKDSFVFLDSLKLDTALLDADINQTYVIILKFIEYYNQNIKA